MKLEEAINHCKEVAKLKCDSCGAEHEQLAEWLEELKHSKKFIGEYCRQNRTIDQCLKCELYEHELCIDKDSATKRREYVKIVIS